MTSSAIALASPADESAAAITADPFTDSCRDVSFHSSKDISHVEIHYGDGRVVKNEDIVGPHFSIDGDTGGEIDLSIVKSGTTTESFACETPVADNPPNAVLERRAGATDRLNPAGTWTDTDCHSATSCIYGSVVGDSVISFRGTASSDPDDDIVSWSIDFGDGTTPATGSWATEPPTEVTHVYEQLGSIYTVVLTVTDSAGRSSSDPMLVSIDNDPGFD